jgi:hypothetical protein
MRIRLQAANKNKITINRDKGDERDGYQFLLRR